MTDETKQPMNTEERATGFEPATFSLEGSRSETKSSDASSKPAGGEDHRDQPNQARSAADVRPRYEHPLTRQERQLLTDLECCSHGTTGSYEPVATKGGFTGSTPPATDAPHISLRADLAAAGANLAKRADLVEAAQADLDAMRRRATPVVVTETEDQLDTRIMAKLDEGWTDDEVALNMRVTPTRVRRAKDNGPAGIHAQILRLAGVEQLSVRSIAIRLKVPKSTVQDVLSRKAA